MPWSFTHSCHIWCTMWRWYEAMSSIRWQRQWSWLFSWIFIVLSSIMGLSWAATSQPKHRKHIKMLKCGLYVWLRLVEAGWSWLRLAEAGWGWLSTQNGDIPPFPPSTHRSINMHSSHYAFGFASRHTFYQLLFPQCFFFLFSHPLNFYSIIVKLESSPRQRGLNLKPFPLGRLGALRSWAGLVQRVPYPDRAWT